MATIDRFEDIEAWKKARELTRAVYSCSNVAPFSKDFALRDQIRRAAVSVMSNIAEGFERGGTKEFVQFLSMAKGSVGELESQLHVAVDQGYVIPTQFDSLTALTDSTRRLIGGLMSYLKETDFRGFKFK